MVDREQRSLITQVQNIFRYRTVTADIDNLVDTGRDQIAEADWSTNEHAFAIDTFDEWEMSRPHRRYQNSRSRSFRDRVPQGALQRRRVRRATAQSQKLINAWRALATALVRRAEGMPCGRRGQRLHKAQMRYQRELQLGKFDNPTLLSRFARWLRSSFEEEFFEGSKLGVKNSLTTAVRAVDVRPVRGQRSPCMLAAVCLSIRTTLYRTVAYSDMQSAYQCVSIRRTVYKFVVSSQQRSARWALVTNALLSAERMVAVASRRRRFTRSSPAPVATFRRWLHLGCDAASYYSQGCEQFVSHRELTLAGHCMRSDTVQLGQQAKRAQRRWNRFVNLMHEQKQEEARQMSRKRSSFCKRFYKAPGSSSGWRNYDQNASYGWRAQNYSDDWSARDPAYDWSMRHVAQGFSPTHAEEAAAQLGIDVETYRMLRELEQREISPDDYDLLGRLDESVKRTTLLPEDLEMFPVHRFCALVEPHLDADRTRFGMDFWRLPVELTADPDGDCACNFASFAFWKLPLLSEEDADESTADGTGASSETSAAVCGVCLLDFEDGEEFRTLKCGHSFHKECIDHWLLNSSTACPIDKRDVRQM